MTKEKKTLTAREREKKMSKLMSSIFKPRKSSLPRTARLRPRKVNRSVADKRREYANRRCVICGFPMMCDVHEIHGGSVRQRTKLDKRYWLTVCRVQHDELQNMPKPKQWALKVLFDPENFDPTALSDLPGVSVDPLEVLRFVAELRRSER